ncbi:hypothetical protein ACVWWK_008012 [Bradyrhizobium sp. LB9.1b]
MPWKSSCSAPAARTLIRLGEENILIDTGRGVMVQLSKAGVRIEI